jgi:hypothetical protein
MEFDELIKQVESSNLPEKNKKLCRDLLHANAWMQRQLEEKKLSIKRLRKIFGIKTEKRRNLKDPKRKGSGQAKNSKSNDEQHDTQTQCSSGGEKPNGHGKRGCDDYPEAVCQHHPHHKLKAGDLCPLCLTGKLYGLEPGRILRIDGQSPLCATIHEVERLRCALCGEVFKAEVSIGEGRFTEGAKSIVAIFKYGSGIPFYRTEGLSKSLGTLVSDSTQWDMVESVADSARPVWTVLQQQAACGELVINDDTSNKILEFMADKDDENSRSVFTTGIVSKVEGHTINLFFTQKQHAGENLKDILEKRPTGLSPPIQMCDAASRNYPKEIETIVSNCLDHARRNFYELYDVWPEQIGKILELFGQIYLNERIAKKKDLDKEQRLKWHQKESAPVMEELFHYCTGLIDSKEVEPNSSFGKAIRYLTKNHWEKLTRFLHVAGAPISSAEVERLLKTAVLHRKNSLFYKTQMGALVSDILMSVIQTSIKAGKNPFHYLTTLQQHAKRVWGEPAKWLPWNYEAALAAVHA